MSDVLAGLNKRFNSHGPCISMLGKMQPSEPPKESKADYLYVNRPMSAKLIDLKKDAVSKPKAKGGRKPRRRRDPANCDHKKDGTFIWGTSGTTGAGATRYRCMGCKVYGYKRNGVIVPCDPALKGKPHPMGPPE